MKTFPLAEHRLSHIRRLRVDAALFRPRFGAGCSMEQCNARCCRDGVFLDPAEKQRIVEHADLIVRHMDEHQVKDVQAWFEDAEHDDDDFPSGRCTGTAAVEYGCVFLNARGWCVLQVAATAEGLGKFALKPTFCVAYPITLNDGVVTVEDGSFTGRTECCAPGREARLTPADVCREEIEHLLGPEAMPAFDALRASDGDLTTSS